MKTTGRREADAPAPAGIVGDRERERTEVVGPKALATETDSIPIEERADDAPATRGLATTRSEPPRSRPPCATRRASSPILPDAHPPVNRPAATPGIGSWPGSGSKAQARANDPRDPLGRPAVAERRTSPDRPVTSAEVRSRSSTAATIAARSVPTSVDPARGDRLGPLRLGRGGPAPASRERGLPPGRRRNRVRISAEAAIAATNSRITHRLDQAGRADGPRALCLSGVADLGIGMRRDDQAECLVPIDQISQGRGDSPHRLAPVLAAVGRDQHEPLARRLIDGQDVVRRSVIRRASITGLPVTWIGVGGIPSRSRLSRAAARRGEVDVASRAAISRFFSSGNGRYGSPVLRPASTWPNGIRA